MASDRSKIDYAKAFLRRKYAKDVPGLKTYAEEVFPEATDPVVLTGTAFEGGSASGQLAFEKVLLGMAIEELIVELDAGYVPPDPPMPSREFGVTVRLGL